MAFPTRNAMLHLGCDVTLLNQAFMLLLEHAHIKSLGIQRATRDRYIWASTDLVVRWSTIVEVPARQRSEMYRKTKGMSFIGTPGSISRVDHLWHHLVVGHRRVGAECWPRFVSQDSRYRGLLVVVVGHRTARIRGTSASSPRGGKWCYNDKSK